MATMNESAREQSLINWTQLISPAGRRFIAVILNYVKRGDVRGTWLESHFRWQIRTFWFGLLWISICLLFIIFTFGLGILIAWLPMGLVGLWFIYRIVRGWLALNDRKSMPA